MLARFDLINLIRDVNEDDAFYYFQIARNLAEGKFSTFDGGITRTNGYHPLWLLLITPFYWVFDKETALFGIKAFEIMLVAGGVALVAMATRLARLPWILLFALLPMLYQQYGFDNLDFAFSDHDVIEGEVCVARRKLPDYGIATLRTGQFTGEGRVWEGSFDIPL